MHDLDCSTNANVICLINFTCCRITFGLFSVQSEGVRGTTNE